MINFTFNVSQRLGASTGNKSNKLPTSTKKRGKKVIFSCIQRIFIKWNAQFNSNKYHGLLNDILERSSSDEDDSDPDFEYDKDDSEREHENENEQLKVYDSYDDAIMEAHITAAKGAKYTKKVAKKSNPLQSKPHHAKLLETKRQPTKLKPSTSSSSSSSSSSSMSTLSQRNR